MLTQSPLRFGLGASFGLEKRQPMAVFHAIGWLLI